MEKRPVTVQLPADLLRAVHDLATEREDTVEKLVENLIVEHLSTNSAVKKLSSSSPEKLIFALQKLLFRDMAEAKDWDDLGDRLRKHGYFLKISWGGLALHTETSGQKLCQTHDLGFSYGTFLRRFGPGKPKEPWAA
ncbi:MAG: hypothetical protein ABJ360_14220 [Roseobacter sp.]